MNDKKTTERIKAANELIEQLETETGCRVDDNNGNNMAMNGLFGAMFRIMGRVPTQLQ